MGFAAPFAPRRLRRDAELVAPSLPSQKKQKAAEAAKKSGNKQRFPKGKKTLDIADWLTQMEYAAASARQRFGVGLGRGNAPVDLGEADDARLGRLRHERRGGGDEEGNDGSLHSQIELGDRVLRPKLRPRTRAFSN